MDLLSFLSLVHIHVTESIVLSHILRPIISQDNEKHEDRSPNQVLGKKPVPTPRSHKERVNQDNKGQLKGITDPFSTHKHIRKSSCPSIRILSFVYSTFLTLY
jgi:hypothetical protein